MRGKAPQKVVRGYTAKDHPRLCGEKLKNYAIVGIEGGSPPPMRGKGIRLVAGSQNAGITPAYAGKSR